MNEEDITIYFECKYAERIKYWFIFCVSLLKKNQIEFKTFERQRVIEIKQNNRVFYIRFIIELDKMFIRQIKHYISDQELYEYAKTMNKENTDIRIVDNKMYNFIFGDFLEIIQ